MEICVFPGTFNPIHNAHLKMAKYAIDKYNFDKIIFIPSYIPPHKNINPQLAEHRYKMVELAISDNPKFEISDIEYSCEGKSYSIITFVQILSSFLNDSYILSAAAPYRTVLITFAFMYSASSV